MAEAVRTGVAVRGLREMQAAFAKADRAQRLALRAGLRTVAEPVRTDAEAMAQQDIPKIGQRWYRMRTGVTRKSVYVAPVQRGIKTRGADPRRRPRFADLLAERALEPALERNEAEIEGRIEDLLDTALRNFDR